MAPAPSSLTDILLDKNARRDERDDAAMDLADHPDALDVLIQVASDKSEDEIILSSCGTSIAEIWKKKAFYNETIVSTLTLPAQAEIKAFFRRNK